MKEFFDYFPMVEQWDTRHTKTLLALFVAKARHPKLWHPRPIKVISRFSGVGKTGFYYTFQRHVYGNNLQLVLEDLEKAYEAAIAIFDSASNHSVSEVVDYTSGKREITPKFERPRIIKSATSFIEMGDAPRIDDYSKVAGIYIPNRVKVVEHPPIDDEFHRLIDKYADEAKAYYLNTIEQLPPVTDYI